MRRLAFLAIPIALLMTFQFCRPTPETPDKQGAWISLQPAISKGAKDALGAKNHHWTAIAFANQVFVAVGTKGMIATSQDGETWHVTQSDIAEDLTSVFQYSGILDNDSQYQAIMAVGQGGAVYSSAQGENWKRILPPQNETYLRLLQPKQEWFGTLQDSGVFLINKGGEAISEFWYRIWTGTRNRLNAAAWKDDLFIAVGDSGTVVYLPDFADETHFRFERGHPTTQADLHGIVWGCNRFMAVGDSGTVLVSIDGNRWEKETIGYAGGIKGVAYGAGKFVALADDKILVKPACSEPTRDSSDSFEEPLIGLWSNPETRAIRLAHLDREKPDTGYFTDPILLPEKNWMETFVPNWGRDAESFVPPGWVIMESVTGDLNRDGRVDLAFVLEAEDEDLMITGERFDEPYFYSTRILGIAFGDTSRGGFRLVKRDDTFIRTRENPHIEEPFSGLTLSDSGVLNIQFHFWTSLGSWETYSDSYQFEFLDGDFTLVSAESRGNWRDNLDSWVYSYDLIKKRKVIRKGNDSLGNESEWTRTEDTLDIPEPIRFENFSELWPGFE